MFENNYSEKEAQSRKEKEAQSRKEKEAEARKLVFERYGEELKLFGITEDDYEEAGGVTFTQKHDYYKPVCNDVYF